MKIAVDAMGGDKAPKVIIEGIKLAQEKYSNIEYILYGDEEQIKKYLTDDLKVEIVHTTEVITFEDSPVKAVRTKKNASLVLAAKAVKEGKADALLSAGNTGALLAAGLLYIGRMKQIERPGLMTTLPSINDDLGTDFIDLGATSDSKAEFLNNYAVLGSVYAKYVRGIDKPKVALLNNGTEETKGNNVTKEAYELLQKNEYIKFIGNLEARDLLYGKADVVVADGFTGNAVLKSTEGAALAVMKLLKQNILSSGMLAKLGSVLLKPVFKKVAAKMDYTAHNGAILMGVKAPVVKSHGSSEASTIAACIEQIRSVIENNVIEEIEKELTILSQD